MSIRRKRNQKIGWILILAIIILVFPFKASGEVKQITELEDRLENITEEEMDVLQELFRLSQEIDSLEQEEAKINREIEQLEAKIAALDKDIEGKQKDYDIQLTILEQVLVNYQRSGPASYLEILLKADNLSTFIKSLNIIKDISHNVNDLLVTVEDSKRILEEERSQLAQSTLLLEEKKENLVVTLKEKQEVQKEQESYLASLQTDKVYYQEQLANLTMLWEECRTLFPSISAEISSIVGEGYFTLEDLNLDSGFFTMSGYLEEETFNQILSEHSTITQTIFSYEEDQVMIEVPEEHLVLKGYFSISGESAIQYEVTEGTFYDMPLEQASIAELFLNGPLLIDFNAVTGDIIIIDFKLTEIWSTEEALNFVIIPQF